MLPRVETCANGTEAAPTLSAVFWVCTVRGRLHAEQRLANGCWSAHWVFRSGPWLLSLPETKNAQGMTVQGLAALFCLCRAYPLLLPHCWRYRSTSEKLSTGVVRRCHSELDHVQGASLSYLPCSVYASAVCIEQHLIMSSRE